MIDAAKPQSPSNPEIPHRGVFSIIWDLIALSRFDRYNPLLATFAGVWGTLLAGNSKMNQYPASISTPFIFKQTLLCFVCSFIFCGAGMVWNDWIDLNIDQQVARTKSRPLAAGRITTTEALIWMGIQYSVSLFLVAWMLGGRNVPEAMIPVTLSTLLYPFGKRPFFRRLYIYPQYMLGYTLAHPSLIGWLAIKGHDQPITSNVRECLALGTTVFLWVLYLNTAYSYQDIKDDQRMKLNSMYTVAGPYIHALLVLLAGLVLGAAALQLKEQNSQWLWGSWMCVSTYSFVSQLLRFDALNPISGGPLHKENCGLGIWTIFACSIELALKK